MGANRTMEIGILGLVLLGFASLHLVVAEAATVTPAFVWSDLRYGFVLCSCLVLLLSS